jgi:hypothetical protein
MGVNMTNSKEYNLEQARLSLSSIYNNKYKELNRLEAIIKDTLTWSQYNDLINKSAGNRIGALPNGVFNKITKSSKLRALHVDSQYVFNQLCEVRQQLDEVILEQSEQLSA